MQFLNRPLRRRWFFSLFWLLSLYRVIWGPKSGLKHESRNRLIFNIWFQNWFIFNYCVNNLGGFGVFDPIIFGLYGDWGENVSFSRGLDWVSKHYSFFLHFVGKVLFVFAAVWNVFEPFFRALAKNLVKNLISFNVIEQAKTAGSDGVWAWAFSYYFLYWDLGVV